MKSKRYSSLKINPQDYTKKQEQVRANLYFAFLMLAFSLWFFFAMNELSLSVYEIREVLHKNSLVAYLVDLSVHFLGQNNYGYRMPFVLLQLCNFVLFYLLCQNFFKKPLDSLLCVCIFALLPANNLAALLVCDSAIILFFVLLILYADTKGWTLLFYLFLLCSLMVHASFILLYISLSFYAFFNKKYTLGIVCLCLFVARLYLGDIDVKGVPKGYFLDTLGSLALLFSPPLFIFYVYALYRFLVHEEKNIVWSLSFGTLLIILFASIRQKISFDHVVPFMVVGILPSLQVFLSSLRVRLKPFRKTYKRGFRLCFAVLLISFLGLVGNKAFYPFLNSPNEHFAYKFQIVHELAQNLQEKGIHALRIPNTHLRLRLQFYGIQSGGNQILSHKPMPNAEIIEIRYLGYVVDKYYVATL